MRARGYTLLETLIALALTALVMGALAGAVRRAAAARDQATAASDRSGVARTLLLRLAAEVEAARPPDPGFERFVVEPSERDRPGARLLFATGTAADLRAVSYTVEPDRTHPGAGVLVRRESAPGATEPPGYAVLDGVRTFGVRCFDGTAWQTSSTDRLPRAIEVTVGLDDGRGGTEELAITITPAVAS